MTTTVHPNPSGISPSKEASFLNCIHRQIFVTPPAVSPRDVNLKGKTAIVTGSNVGLGFQCANQLLGLGLSKLILAVRDESKGKAAKDKLSVENSSASIEVWPLDLAAYDSVTAFVERTKTLNRLDMVILNAGIVKNSYQRNPSTQHEETIQINYLSTVLLTILLLPVLKDKNPPKTPGRLVIVNSDTSAWAKFKERNSPPLLEALDKPQSFDVADRYWTSKLLCQLFLVKLTNCVPSSVAVITATNPGLCGGTQLNQESHGTMNGYIMAIMKGLLGRKVAVGARTLTDAAVKHGQEVHGQYLADCKLKPMAPLIYEPRGAEIGDMLWRETMAELSFAKVEDIVQGLSK